MNLRLHHEVTDCVFVGLGVNTILDDGPQADVTICNGFYHFHPRNDGSCTTEKCDCRDRQKENDSFHDHLHFQKKYSYRDDD